MDRSTSIDTVLADASETQMKVVDGDGDDLRHCLMAVDVREKHKKDCERKQQLRDAPTKGSYKLVETYEFDICAPYYAQEEQVKCPLKGKRTMSEQFSPPSKFTQFDSHRIVHHSRKGIHLNDPDAFQVQPTEIRRQIERVPLLPKLGCSQVSFVARKNKEKQLEREGKEVQSEKTEVPASDKTSKLVLDPMPKISKVLFAHDVPANSLLETPPNPLLESGWKKCSQVSVFSAARESQLHWGDGITETPAVSCGPNVSAEPQVYEISSIKKPFHQHEGVHDIFNGPYWKNPIIASALPAPNQATTTRPSQPRTHKHFTGDQCNLMGPRKLPSTPMSSTRGIDPGTVRPSMSIKDSVHPEVNIDTDSAVEEETDVGLSSPTMENKHVYQTVDMNAGIIGDSIPSERTRRQEQRPTKPGLLRRLFSCAMCLSKRPVAADSESEVYVVVPHESRVHNSIVDLQSPKKTEIRDNALNNKHKRQQTSSKLK